MTHSLHPLKILPNSLNILVKNKIILEFWTQILTYVSTCSQINHRLFPDHWNIKSIRIGWRHFTIPPMLPRLYEEPKRHRYIF